jgi:peroxiredoxin
LCNLRVSQMIERRAEFERYGLAILGVFQSPPERLAKYVGKQEPPFPLLSDPEEKLYALYGLEASFAKYIAPAVLPKLAKAMAKGFMPGATDGSITRVPADFLIDENGMVADAFYGRDIADHIPFERVERFMTAGR